ncbi:MAG: electron transfer flavoprotein subunit beta/FixA family protein [Xanthomonadales bacterium]|nr:electron transfer flavoprotein subunit beta/FixA family protein [Xanthomonadales bacterium]
MAPDVADTSPWLTRASRHDKTREDTVKIGVCIKQVPAKDSPIAINEDGRWIREDDLKYELCGPDEYALEAAIQIKEQHGGEVVAVSLGPARSTDVLRTALAKGADRAVHIQLDAPEVTPPLPAAKALAEALSKESFDLILSGLQSDDQGFGQTGVIVAELLGIAHTTVVVDLEVTDGEVKVKRELEGGWYQSLSLPLPAMLAIQSGINTPRYASFKGIIAAKKKPLESVPAAASTEAHQQTLKIYVPEKTKDTQFLEGDPDDAAQALIAKLKTEAGILS